MAHPDECDRFPYCLRKPQCRTWDATASSFGRDSAPPMTCHVRLSLASPAASQSFRQALCALAVLPRGQSKLVPSPSSQLYFPSHFPTHQHPGFTRFPRPNCSHSFDAGERQLARKKAVVCDRPGLRLFSSPSPRRHLPSDRASDRRSENRPDSTARRRKRPVGSDKATLRPWRAPARARA